jgi:sugar-specific transcriptional regulator TrmB
LTFELVFDRIYVVGFIDTLYKHMNSTQYIETLKDFGLSDTEASVYFAMVSLGPSPILQISKSSGVKRTTVYSIVEALKQKGLAREDVNGFKTLYAAENPNTLLLMLEQKKDRLKEHLGDLLSMYTKGEKETFIKIYESWESIKSVYLELLNEIKPHQEYLIISSMSTAFDYDREFFTKLREKRAKLPITIRALISDPETDEGKAFKKFDRNFNIDSRFLPNGTDLSTNLVITPQKVLIHRFGEPASAIVIENKDIIKMHQEFFNVMWNSADI